MGFHMSRYHTTTVPGLGSRPQMGLVRIVMCVSEKGINDVIGCEYRHLRLIDLCISTGVREKGKGKKKIKKRRQSKVFGEIPPAPAVNCWLLT